MKFGGSGRIGGVVPRHGKRRLIGRRRLACTFFLLLWLSLPGLSHAYIIINAPMTDTNSSGWLLGGNPSSAQLTGDGSIDPVGSGWLRLTNATNNQTGFAYNNTTFDLSAGLLIQFDYASWGGSGADGTSVFLFDAGAYPFNIGAFGGSLGYAQKLPPAVPSVVPGVSGGYVGIGLDEFGNFANPTEGRYLGPGQTPNTVTMRGSVLGFGGGAVGQTGDGTSYPWITTSGNSGSLWTNTNSCGTAVSCRPSQTGPNYRKVIIEISPPDANGYPYASLWVQFGYNTSPQLISSNVQLPQISSSQQLMVGFGASTGGSTDYHEVRNLTITNAGASTSIDLGITKTAVAQGTSTQLSALPVGAPFQYVLTAANFGPNDIFASGVGVTDLFPANVTAGNWTCNVVNPGTSDKGSTACPSPPSGTTIGNRLSSLVNLSQGGSVAFTVNATIPTVPAGNTVTNSASLTIPGAITDYYSGNNSATLTLPAYSPLAITKSFSPSTVTSRTTATTLTITVSNPTPTAAAGIGFTDSYPSGLTNASTWKGHIAGTCKSTYGAAVTASTGGLAVSGITLPAGGSCTLTENDVVGAAAGTTYTNTIPAGAVTSTTANILSNAVAASDNFTIMASATLPKPTQAFSPAQVAVNGASALTMTFSNPNGADITGVGFVDPLTTGAVISGTPTTTCTNATITPSSNTLTVSGLSIPPGGCTITANVTSATAGSYTSPNTFTISSANDGSTTMTAATTLTVLNLPTVTKSFAAPGSILPGGGSPMTVTLTNPNATVDITGAQFTDSFPAGLLTTGTAATNCSGGTATASNNGTVNGVLTLAGATIPHNGSCTVTVAATGSTPGSYLNTIAANAVTTANAGANAAAASAPLVVMAPPTVAKVFSPTSIAIGGSTTLSITVTNPNSVAITGVGFTDKLQTGMANVATGTSSQCGGTVTATNGATPSLALSGGTVAANGSCTITGSVTINAAGNYSNTIAAGGVTTANSGSNAVSATANLNGPQPPVVTKSFSASPIVAGAGSTLTINIANPNGFGLTNAAFTDSYPAGMVNLSTPAATNSCGGTLTAVAGGNTLSLANGTVPTSGCVITVPVTSTTGGTSTNTMSAVTTNEAPASNAASATIAVILPPTVAKSFSPASVVVDVPSTMTITLTNPATNSSAITGVNFTDSYPTNGGSGTLVNSAATTAFDSSSSPGCSGTITAAAGSGSLSLSGGSIPVGGSCVIKASVTGATAGTYNNSTGSVTTGNSGSGAAATATLTTTLQAAPTVTKAFSPTSMPTGGSSTMTIAITNPTANTLPITGVNFTDSYPTNGGSGTLTNTTTAAFTAGSITAGCSGTVTGATGTGSLALSGGSIPANTTCTITVNVTSSAAGTYNNSTGPVASANAVTATGAAASLGVLAAPTVTDSFVPPTVPITTASTLTIAIANQNTTDLTGAGFTDNYTLVSGIGSLVNASIPNAQFINKATGTSCGGTITATPGGASLTLSGGVIPANTTCTLTVSVHSTGNTNNAVGTYQNSVTVASANAPGSAAQSAQLVTTVLASPGIATSFNPTNVPADGQPHTSILTITLTNPNSSAITGVTGGGSGGLIDSYPSGMTTAGSATLYNSCGGTATLASGSISLTGGSIPANGSCTLSTSVQVTTTTAGRQYQNTTTYVTTSDATPSTSTSNTATLTAAALTSPTAAMSFVQSQIGVNGSSTLTIALTNPSSNTGAITGVSFTDSYPGNGSGGTLVNTANAAFTPASISAGCSGTLGSGSGTSSLSLSGGSIPLNTTCSITVTVTSASAGSYGNSVVINTSNAGSVSTSASLNVLLPPQVTAQFNPAMTTVNSGTPLSYTIYNPNGIAITGASFTDSYPASLLNAATASGACSASSSVCNCQAGSITAAGSGGSLLLTGGTIPGNATCTVSVNVLSGTPGSYANLSGGGNLSVSTSNAGTATVTPVTLVVSSLPTLSVVKTASSTSGKPGDVITYTVTVTNPSSGYASNVILTDTLNPYAYLGYTSFQFQDGASPSGLTLGTTSFDNGGGWGYVAGSDLTAPNGYDGKVTRWQIPMGGVMNPNGASFTLTYRIMIK